MDRYRFRGFVLLMLLELINYILTTTPFNNISTKLDILLFIFIFIYEFMFFSKKQLSKMSIIIIFLLLVKVAFAHNILQCAFRASSLIIQIMLFYEIPSSFFSSRKEANEDIIHHLLKNVYLVIIIATSANVIVMLYGKLTGTFEIAGIKIGNYINGRYNGLFNTPAFCGEITTIALIMSFFNLKDKSKIHKLYGIFLVVITFYLSKTRTALVASLVFIFVYILKTIRIKEKWLMKALACIGSFTILVMCLLFINSDTINEISSFRWVIWQSVLEQSFSIKNLLGANDIETSVVYSGGVYAGGVHNAFLQLLYNVGPIITLAICVYLVIIIVNIKNKKHNGDKYYAVIFSGIMSLFTFNLFESHLFFLRSPNSFMIWFLFLIARLKYDKKIQLEGEKI